MQNGCMKDTIKKRINLPVCKSDIIDAIKRKKSFLCIGLDSDFSLLPQHLLKEKNPVLSFNKSIIDATSEFAVAYKPNLAFYEQMGSIGWDILQKTFEYIPEGILKIADAKRGDIGNTACKYAFSCFDFLGADAVTINPYMGKDTVEPFLEYNNKWAILLALTSNPGADDFETLSLKNHRLLYEQIIVKSAQWGSSENMMFVAGATHPDMIKSMRTLVPDHFLLVPGVGIQGGNLEKVAENGINDECGLIVNASRSVIFSSSGKDFAQKAAEEAKKLKTQMSALLYRHGIL